ncbi:hypothetical protein LJC69_01225 [Bacteroidales bacterium OttesenSCG-928-K22]|nr:hypothetical protein [Bacteroidales bacterium OttesenSCG-928-L14]MDL2240224.1 hypothetical protein [Bacteroidales bacterium OttesenSCG-928-K22]
MDNENNIDNNFLSRGFVKEVTTDPSDQPCYKNSCAKLSVYNWLEDIPLSQDAKKNNIYEVRFKNTTKGFYRAPEDLKLKVGDIIAVESSPGHDIGIVSATDTVAMLQLYKKGFDENSENIKKIYRKAKNTDIEKWINAVKREKETANKAKEIIESLKLDMKLNDVEYQGDGAKATFYYTADDRVDFRELIKILAETFRIRIEMKQIGIRQEASRIGGVGSCGRELCCSTWITKFTSVTTSSARVQQLTLNPVKLAGQCGKLKCCLNYEYDTYVDALKEFPDNNIILRTESGDASYVKSDVFKKFMWYSYNNSNDNSIMAIPIDKVKEIIEMNKKGKKPAKLEDFAFQKEQRVEIDEGVVTPDDLTRFDD